jgi:CheY-like chemotaxis protein
MSGQGWTGGENPFGQWLGVEPGSGDSGGWDSSPAGSRDTDESETSPRILLVEDEPDVREAVKAILEDHGYRVTAAENGWEALELLRSGRAPDVIVLDLRMPIMDGWEFRALQKRNPDLAGIPVVAISADGSAKAAAIDAQAYLRKPINPDSLVETVSRIVGGCVRPTVNDALDDMRKTSALAHLAASIGREIDTPLVHLMISVDVVAQDLDLVAERSVDGKVTTRREDLNHLCELLRDCRLEFERIRKLLGILQKLSPPLEVQPEPPTLEGEPEDSGLIRGRVLVIDDEPLMGRNIRSALAGEHEVTAVSLASEAFARLAAGETYDVILCDLFMQEMSGREVYERLVSDWPRAARKVVFMSDSVAVPEASEFVNRTSRPVLFKPFQVDELRLVVRAQLDEHLKELN